uniref:EF-hand domain-containing protein n=1 Tax=Arcella intermedia TaxID=1963864 RepID=A0A6B2LKG6_9EUKA
MGNNQGVSHLNHLKTKNVLKEAQHRIGQKTLDQLSADWAKVSPDKTKSIDFEKFKVLMDTMNEAALRALFSLYDLNNDNKIAFKEYVCVVALVMNGSLEEKVGLLFNAFDENKDGKISFKEFGEAVRRFSVEEAGEEGVRRIFERCDKDGNGEISPEEFKALLDGDRDTFNFACGILAVGVGT